MDKFLDIDFVRKNNIRMYYFGLGFIQVIFDEVNRVHFYSPLLPSTTDGIHNHRYNFKSTILKGGLSEDVFALTPGNKYILKNENCGRDILLPHNPEILIGAGLEYSNYWHEGGTYERMFNEFHSVGTEERTITHLERGQIILDYAQVLTEIGQPEICPFAEKHSNSYLYEVIEDTIKN